MRRARFWAMGLALAASLTGCKPASPARSGPPPAPTPVAASAPARVARSAYSAAVSSTGPGVWTYDVSARADAADAGFEAVRLRTTTDLKGCDLKVPASDPALAAMISRPGATGLRADTGSKGTWRSARLVLTCPGMKDGHLSLVITDVTGALREWIVVGPIVGPRN